jgi:hypothetical protein
LSPQKSRTSVTVGVAACCGEAEPEKAWTLKADNDPNRPQARTMANLFDMGVVSFRRAIVDRQKCGRSLPDAVQAGRVGESPAPRDPLTQFNSS